LANAYVFLIIIVFIIYHSHHHWLSFLSARMGLWWKPIWISPQNRC